jgi:hypothetical protein
VRTPPDARASGDAQIRGMFRRFMAYGLAGWGLEVFFTGLTGALGGQRTLPARTYLWMLPIYGAGGMVLEQAHARLSARNVPRWKRALVYTAAIYAIEYGSAEALQQVGVGVPWKYVSGIHLRGYVRLDYAPFWYACGFLFETLAGEIGKLNRPRRVTPRGRTSQASLHARPVPMASSA